MIILKFIISISTILILITGNATISNAQETPLHHTPNTSQKEKVVKEGIQLNSNARNADTGNVELIRDPRIDALLEKHIAINKKQKGIPGYRVQIFFGSKRKDALNLKADFLKKYPDIDAYTEYDEPYFKVRVGDFRTQLKAQKFHKELSGDFPNAFIVNDLIKYALFDL